MKRESHTNEQWWQHRREALTIRQHKYRASLVAQRLKRLPAMWETWVRSLHREDTLEKENGNPLQYSCPENPMEGGAWYATVHGVAKSRTRLSNFTSLHFIYICVCVCVFGVGRAGEWEGSDMPFLSLIRVLISGGDLDCSCDWESF